MTSTPNLRPVLVRVTGDPSGIVVEGQQVDTRFMGPVPRLQLLRGSRRVISNRRWCEFPWPALELSYHELAHGPFPPVPRTNDQREPSTTMDGSSFADECSFSSSLSWLDSPKSDDDSFPEWECEVSSSHNFVIYEDPLGQETPRPETPEPFMGPCENKENMFVLLPHSSPDEPSRPGTPELDHGERAFNEVGTPFLARIDPSLTRRDHPFDADPDEDDIPTTPPPPPIMSRLLLPSRLNLVNVTNNELLQAWNRVVTPEQASDLNSLSDMLIPSTGQTEDGVHSSHIFEAGSDENNDYNDADDSSICEDDDNEDSTSTDDNVARDPNYSPEEEDEEL